MPSYICVFVCFVYLIKLILNSTGLMIVMLRYEDMLNYKAGIVPGTDNNIVIL